MKFTGKLGGEGRDPNRIKPFLEEIEKIWLDRPDLRFAQLISNFYNFLLADPFYVEDEDFIKRFKEYYGKE